MRAMARAARPRSTAVSGVVTGSWNTRDSASITRSTARRVMDAGGDERLLLQLLGKRQRALRRPRRGRLRLRRGGQPQQKRAAQLVVVALVRLDDVAVERGGIAIARALAELDELAVLHDGDGFPRELARRHALHRGGEAVEIREERPEARRQRIDRRRIEAELPQALGDHAVV